MNKEVSIRDFIAFPFMIISFIFILLGISIGGKWTAIRIREIIN